jgi:hypothetical protein
MSASLYEPFVTVAASRWAVTNASRTFAFLCLGRGRESEDLGAMGGTRGRARRGSSAAGAHQEGGGRGRNRVGLPHHPEHDGRRFGCGHATADDDAVVSQHWLSVAFVWQRTELLLYRHR